MRCLPKHSPYFSHYITKEVNCYANLKQAQTIKGFQFIKPCMTSYMLAASQLTGLLHSGVKTSYMPFAVPSSTMATSPHPSDIHLLNLPCLLVRKRMTEEVIRQSKVYYKTSQHKCWFPLPSASQNRQ